MRANGRARVNAKHPSAFGICDRDGFRYNLRDLIWQYEWSGIKLQNTRFLVCRRCLDKPNEQLRAYAVPPDPIPVRNPRPDLSYMGNAPLIVTTVACIAPVYLLDGHRNPILDGHGNPIILTEGSYPAPLLDGFGNPILDGFGNPITEQIPGYPQLLPADPDRYEVDFDIPPAFGIFINANGGPPYPNWPGSQFYAPGGAFQLNGPAAQSAINYFTTIAGLTLVVQTLG